MNNTCLIVLTAGRLDYLDRTISSLNKNLKGSISKRIIIDNSDGPIIKYDGYHTLKIPSLGLPYGEVRHSAVLRLMFKLFRQLSYENIVFFEEDWEVVSEIDVDSVIPFIGEDVSQIKFARNARYADFSLETFKATVKEDDMYIFKAIEDDKWFFSWNPSIFNKRMFNSEYPLGPGHEYQFGQTCLGTIIVVPNYKKEIVRHIGIESISQHAIWDEDGVSSSGLVV